MKEEPFLKTECNIDRPFTLLGYTALTGNPLLCLKIIKGVQEKFNTESGIDPFDTQTFGDASDHDYFDKNFGYAKLFLCDPTYKFLGKEIPYMVKWSPKGIISSQILTKAPVRIDSYNACVREEMADP